MITCLWLPTVLWREWAGKWKANFDWQLNPEPLVWVASVLTMTKQLYTSLDGFHFVLILNRIWNIFSFQRCSKTLFSCFYSPNYDLVHSSFSPPSPLSTHAHTAMPTKRLWCLWTGTRMGTGCWQHPGTIWSRCMTSGPWRRCTLSRDTRRMSTVREMETHRLSTTKPSYLRRSGLVPRLSFEFGMNYLIYLILRIPIFDI